MPIAAKRFLGALDADATAGKSNLDQFQKFAVASTSQKPDIRLLRRQRMVSWRSDPGSI
jgi:hypothetical protein